MLKNKHHIYKYNTSGYTFKKKKHFFFWLSHKGMKGGHMAQSTILHVKENNYIYTANDVTKYSYITPEAGVT